MEKHYKYSLGRLVTSCPQCHRREFKPYLDENGQMLDPAVGRCNRELNCGYHLKPRDFFATDPVRKPTAAQPRRRPTDFMPLDLVRRSFTVGDGPDNLTRYFCGLFPEETVREVFRLYNVGRTKLYPAGTMFWFVDEQMRVRTGKAMAYGPDGHRLRTKSDSRTATVSYVHHMWRDGFNCSLCYFGAHLSEHFTQATLLLVESEKTALYLACLIGPEGLSRYLPMATGGCSSLSYDPFRGNDDDYRGRVLQQRDIILLPDADATQKWHAMTGQLEKAASSVRMLDLRNYAGSPTDDIMDIHLRRRTRQRPRPALPAESEPVSQPSPKPMSIFGDDDTAACTSCDPSRNMGEAEFRRKRLDDWHVQIMRRPDGSRLYPEYFLPENFFVESREAAPF